MTSVRPVPTRRRMDFTRRTSSRGLKGFGDVVVSAQFESDDTIDLFASSSQHEDGNAARRGLLPERAADFHAIDVRQHDVENDQVRRLLLNKFQRLASGRRALNFEACMTQVVADQPNDIGIVIHDQDAFHAGCPAP